MPLPRARAPASLFLRAAMGSSTESTTDGDRNGPFLDLLARGPSLPRAAAQTPLNPAICRPFVWPPPKRHGLDPRPWVEGFCAEVVSWTNVVGSQMRR